MTSFRAHSRTSESWLSTKVPREQQGIPQKKSMPNLCASVTFNPPVVTLVDPPRGDHPEAGATPACDLTTASQSKEPPKFVYHKDRLAHIDLGQQFCDHLGRSAIYLALIGAWPGGLEAACELDDAVRQREGHQQVLCAQLKQIQQKNKRE